MRHAVICAAFVVLSSPAPAQDRQCGPDERLVCPIFSDGCTCQPKESEHSSENESRPNNPPQALGRKGAASFRARGLARRTCYEWNQQAENEKPDEET